MSLGKMSDKQLNMLIDELCIGRNNDNNAQLLDNINNASNIDDMNQIASDYYYNEEHSNRMILNSIEEETLKDIFNGILSVEDVNSLKSNGLYDKYIEYINKNKQSSIKDTKSIEEEIKLELEREDQENDARFQKENTYQSIENNQNENTTDNKEIYNKIIEKENNTMENLQNQDVNINEENNTEEIVNNTISNELLESIPPTSVDISDDSIKTRLSNDFSQISSDDIITILDVMKRFKAGEKFNVYSALPKSFQMEINKAYMDSADLNDKSVKNFLAKNFINELVTDIYLSEGINDFNSELQQISNGLNNVPGLIVDGYTDDLKQKFETQLLKCAEDIKDTDEAKYNELLNIVNSFKDTYLLNTLLSIINDKPSILNRAYKAGKNDWNLIVYLNRKAYESYESPYIKSIKCILDTLTQKYPNKDKDILKAFAVLVHYSMEEYKHKGKICSHVYAYYITTAFVNMKFSANNSEIISNLSEVTEKVLIMIENYVNNINSNKKKKKKHGKR